MQIFAKNYDPTKHFFDLGCGDLGRLGQKSPKFDCQSQFSMPKNQFNHSVKNIKLRDKLV